MTKSRARAGSRQSVYIPGYKEAGHGDNQRHRAPRVAAHQNRTFRTREAHNSRRNQGTAGSDILTIAGVHEYGATIRAKNVKNLAIPLDKKSEGKSPRDFPGLFFIRAKDTGNLFGVTSAGKEKLNFLFLLCPSVTIPERSFIRASYDTGQSELEAACRAAVDHIMLEGGTAKEAAEIIGARAVAMTQQYILDGIDPPKSDITMNTAKTPTPLLRQRPLAPFYQLRNRGGITNVPVRKTKHSSGPPA